MPKPDGENTQKMKANWRLINYQGKYIFQKNNSSKMLLQQADVRNCELL